MQKRLRTSGSIKRRPKPRMDEMMSQGSPEQVKRVSAAFLKMKKFSIADLEAAFDS